jgi:N-acetylglucosaminyldiphosphoundecaprenol N-acetyl-beta-D-mannosaminyltransferase
MMTTTRNFGHVPIRVAGDGQAAEDLLRRALAAEVPTTYRLVNAYTLALASRDPAYERVLQGPGINLPDGLPLAKVLSWTNPDIPVDRVRGPSLFEECLDRGRKLGVRHYLLGGTRDTLAKLTREIQRRFPGAVIVGAESPPFRGLSDDERAAQVERVRASQAHVVWVALGTPKQDFEALRLMRDAGVTTAAVGAAFDFTAGTVRQAPEWMRSAGLEWLFRLGTEPRRLWRRYLFGNARFLLLVAKHLRRGARR